MPVAARFHEIRDRVIASVDKKFAEPVFLAPQKENIADTGRPAMEIEAVLRTGDESISPFTGGKDKTWNSEVATQTAQLNIDRTKYPDVALVKGDKIRAISRKGEPWFAVLHIDDRSHGRLIAHLGGSR